jgi:hypothetical protein
MTESLGKVGDTIAGAARTTTRAIVSIPHRMQNRKADASGGKDPTELNP